MIKGYKKIIDETLVSYFDEILENKTHIFAKKTIEAMKYTTCLGGKRLRGILCLESCRLASNDYFAAIPAACALEMLHAQSLIHDDLPSMDNDDLRRGKPSNHKVFGEAFAILAGDALISLGAQIIADKTSKAIPSERILKAIREYLLAAGIYGIVGGQTADLEAEDSTLNLRDNKDYLNYIQTYKTGALFEASTASGAIIGGASSEKVRTLKEFAKNFGLAFQMADDILDVISTSKEMGKTTGKDEFENKLTYVKKYGLEGAKQKLILQIQATYDILKKDNIESGVFDEIIEQISKRIF